MVVSRAMTAPLREEGNASGEATADAALPFVVFRSGAIWYAVEARHVTGLVATPEIVLVPGTPAFVLGVANVAGKIAVVLDFSMLLGRPRESAPAERLVLFESEGAIVAAIADEIAGVQAVTPSALQPIGDGEPRTTARETFNDGEKLVTVLDFDAVIALAKTHVTETAER